jgi:hypothetical protein
LNTGARREPDGAGGGEGRSGSCAIPDPSPSANLSALGPEVLLFNASAKHRSFPSKFPLSAGNRERLPANSLMCRTVVRAKFHELRSSRRKGL